MEDKIKNLKFDARYELQKRIDYEQLQGRDIRDIPQFEPIAKLIPADDDRLFKIHEYPDRDEPVIRPLYFAHSFDEDILKPWRECLKAYYISQIPKDSRKVIAFIKKGDFAEDGSGFEILPQIGMTYIRCDVRYEVKDVIFQVEENDTEIIYNITVMVE